MERYTEEEFWEHFGRIEHEALEFKREMPTKPLDAVPAMAMTDGGTILLGIEEDEKKKTVVITGYEMRQQDYDRITNMILDQFNMEVKKCLALFRQCWRVLWNSSTHIPRALR